MTRFKAGDVVVLNGYRLTVVEPETNAGFVKLSNRDGDDTPYAVPSEWVPDPVEPNWKQGDVVLDSADRVFRRAGYGWLATGQRYTVAHLDPVRPLVRLVPEHPSEPATEPEAEAEGTPTAESVFTRGQFVSDQDGRLGVVDSTTKSFVLWLDTDGVVNANPPAELRPVTLVEKPTRARVREVLLRAVTSTRISRPASSVRQIDTYLIDEAFDVLFGAGTP